MTSPATPAVREKAADIARRILRPIHHTGEVMATTQIITAALAAEREAAIADARAECREFLAVNGHKQALADMERKLGGEG